MKKKVVVVGAGKTGIATANFLANLGMEVILNDKNKVENRNVVHRKVKIVDEGHYRNIFKEAELVVVSPGVNVKELPIEKEKEVIGDIELFSWFDESKVIAITGTNGKTTTTFLTGKILEKKYNVFVGGNIGTPALMRFLPYEEYDFSVLELSSFQLETVDKFYADIAVILNITPDHLDRYKSLDEYITAKLKILKNQKESQIVIVNGAYEILKNLKVKGDKVVFQKESIISNGKLKVKWKDRELKLELDRIKLKGYHFYEDIYVAALIGLINRVPEEDIEEVVYGFKGLEHRLEFVMERNGVSYYNDSKSTTVSSTCMAIESFDNPVILILGGIEKGESFRKMLKYSNLKKVICFGRSKGKIVEELRELNPEIADNLEDAVKKAKAISRPGDIILFSPACSSFDMFKNYIERGNYFKDLIK